jgi:hypothetical protein
VLDPDESWFFRLPFFGKRPPANEPCCEGVMNGPKIGPRNQASRTFRTVPSGQLRSSPAPGFISGKTTASPLIPGAPGLEG